MYQNDPLKVLTGECRLSYCHLDKPYAPNASQEPKYSVTLLIPKTDVATKADIDNAIQAAITDGVTNKWGGKRPAMPAVPIWDGDGVRANGEPFGPECKGHWVMTASTKQKPQVVHQSNVRVELMPTDIYSGMYGRVTIRFFAYDQAGKKGIGCGLGNVMKTRDGETLAANRSTAEEDFASLEQTEPPAQAYPGGYPVTNPAQQAYPAQAPAAPAYPPQQPTYPGYPAQPQAPAYPQQAYGYPAGTINPITGQPM